MSSPCVTIVDYQMGNLRSVQKAVERVGGVARIAGDPDLVRQAECLLLPGVGAFGDAMQELRERQLIEPIREFLASGRPFLGICLGLQLLFESSEEGGQQIGLGVLPGHVMRFQLPREFKVPHMGWNTVEPTANATSQNSVVGSIQPGDYFYFVHSYYVVPAVDRMVALRSTYHDTFCAMIQHENILATQFHPEKSQAVGLRLLSSFLQSIA